MKATAGISREMKERALPTLWDDDRQGDDRYGTDGKKGDIKGFGSHLKQSGVPTRQHDPFHRAYTK